MGKAAKASAAASLGSSKQSATAQDEVKEKPQGKKASTKGKESKAEIDAIFASQKLKRKSKSEDEAKGNDGPKGAEGAAAPGKKGKPKKRKSGDLENGEGESVRESAAAGQSTAGRPRKKTNDGLNVYSADELQWNKKEAGGTPLCPFDCECCF
eukprot:TRINITY_DN23958_c0_g1_i1.p1 TRINITY_DN23958_c0_g1~~TRINITY_DN23958_c0_g1_i1.p1  ORF type:complete len:154 (+),score=43.02 TRINITY_DN23958_c0_g1_i1:81-542(+)